MDPTRIFSDAFSIETIIAVVVFGLICLTVLTAMWLSRRAKKRDQPPAGKSKDTPLELAYAAVVAGVVGFIVFLSFRATAQEHVDPARHAAHITVTGFQWCWSFRYPSHHVTVTGTCQNGNRPTMVVPVGVPITVRTISDDVIHSWWVPQLRYKMDTFPNHTNTFTFTVNHSGRWIGRCAEYCGLNHYAMTFYLKAVPADQYQRWLAGEGAHSA